MGGLFGKPKEKKSDFSEKDRAVLELKRQRIRLVEYRKTAVGVLERETEIARALLKRGEKKRALLTLKKKRYQQTLLDKTDQQLFNLEELCSAIEFAAVQQKVFEALKNGNTVLQKINDTMKLEDVEKLMEDSAEAVEHQNKVNEMLGNELTAADNDAIEKELAAFEEADAKQSAKVDAKVDAKADHKTERRPSLSPIAVPPILLDGRLDLQSPSLVPAGPGLEPSTPILQAAAVATAQAAAVDAGAAEPVAVAVGGADPPTPQLAAKASSSVPAPKRSLVLA